MDACGRVRECEGVPHVVMLWDRYCRARAGNIKALVPFLKTLEEVKQPAHIVGGHALIRSLPGCGKQAEHRDYLTMGSHPKVRGEACPYSVVVAVEGGSSLYVLGEKIDLPLGSAIVFRGDVRHSGSEYKTDNIRYHLYVDVLHDHEARKGTHVQWIPAPA